MSGRCYLGYHAYVPVGEQQREEFPGGTFGWNHECVRCHKTAWLARSARPKDASKSSSPGGH